MLLDLDEYSKQSKTWNKKVAKVDGRKDLVVARSEAAAGQGNKGEEGNI